MELEKASSVDDVLKDKSTEEEHLDSSSAERYKSTIACQNGRKQITERNAQYIRELADYADSLIGEQNYHNPELLEYHKLCTLAKRLHECRRDIEYRDYYYLKEEDVMPLNRQCEKHILCPMCARSRSMRMVNGYHEAIIEQLINSDHHLFPTFLTLTVKNGDDLLERFEHLKKSFKKLLNRRKDPDYDTEFNKVVGGVYSYEVTNKGKGWHPHIHAILLQNDFIDKPMFTGEWESITKDSCNTDLKVINADENGTFIKPMLEVFKYTLKHNDMSPEKNLQAYLALYRKKLTGSFGSLYGVKIDKKTPLNDLFYHRTILRYMDDGYQPITESEYMQEPENKYA